MTSLLLTLALVGFAPEATPAPEAERSPAATPEAEATPEPEAETASEGEVTPEATPAPEVAAETEATSATETEAGSVTDATPEPDAEAAVATPATPLPTVRLVAEDAQREWLVVRLLEDGYPLTASPEAAQIELAISARAEGGWSVTATGESSASFDVAASNDQAVTQLELLHHSLDALEDVTPRASGQPLPAARFSVAEHAPASVGSQLAAEVLAAGVTLVPSGAQAQLHVCGEQRPGEAWPRVVVVDGRAQCPWPLDVAPGTDTRRAIAEAMEGDESEPWVPEVVDMPQESEDERPPGLESEPPPRRGRTLMRNAPWVVRGGASIGPVVRGRTVDTLLTADLHIGREPGLGAWIEFQIRPATVTGDFRVVELMPAIGGQLRPLEIRRFSLLLGALVGVELHRYRLRPEGIATAGLDVGWSSEAMLGAAFAVWKRHEVQLGLRVGRGAGREHRFNGERIWGRRAARVGVTLGFMFGKELGA